jgi:hypothetical protein
MPKSDRFPPSGRELTLYGVRLNEQPREFLLQAIEYEVTRNLPDVGPMHDKTHKDAITRAFKERCRQIRRAACR